MAEEGRGRGRPRGGVYTERVKVCITPELKEALENAAEIEDRSFSAMCSMALEEWYQAHRRKYEKQES